MALYRGSHRWLLQKFRIVTNRARNNGENSGQIISPRCGTRNRRKVSTFRAVVRAINSKCWCGSRMGLGRWKSSWSTDEKKKKKKCIHILCMPVSKSIKNIMRKSHGAVHDVWSDRCKNNITNLKRSQRDNKYTQIKRIK